jgi:predicted permease
VRGALAEGAVLAVLGGALGLLATRGLVATFVALSPAPLPQGYAIAVDWRVLLFCVGLAAVTGLLFSLSPAVYAARSVRRAAQTVRGASTDRAGTRARRLVVIGELATALALLVVAALFGRSFMALSRVNPGFSYEHVLTARLWMSLPANPSTGPYASRDKQIDLLRQSLGRVAQIPGVERAAWTSDLPFDTSGATQGFLIEGQSVESSLVDVAEPLQVTPGYFDALGIPLVRGRVFADSDSVAAPPVMVISESVARRYFPTVDPIGKRVRPGGPTSTAPWLTVVGVVGDVRSVRLDAEPGAQIYRCAWQRPNLAMTLLVRASGPPAGLAEAVRQATRQIDPNVPLFKIQTMEAVLGSSITERRFALRLVAMFAGLAVVLASIGLYGLASQVVVQRGTEIAIRVALGASPQDVTRMLLRQGLQWTIAGIGVGLVVAMVAARVIAGSLFGVTATDPVAYVSVVAIVGVVALGACWPSAWRASRADPVRAIRGI